MGEDGVEGVQPLGIGGREGRKDAWLCRGVDEEGREDG